MTYEQTKQLEKRFHTLVRFVQQSDTILVWMTFLTVAHEMYALYTISTLRPVHSILPLITLVPTIVIHHHLLHAFIHDHVFQDPTANRVAGMLMSLIGGLPMFEYLRLIHNIHHDTYKTPDKDPYQVVLWDIIWQTTFLNVNLVNLALQFIVDLCIIREFGLSVLLWMCSINLFGFIVSNAYHINRTASHKMHYKLPSIPCSRIDIMNHMID